MQYLRCPPRRRLRLAKRGAAAARAATALLVLAVAGAPADARGGAQANTQTDTQAEVQADAPASVQAAAQAACAAPELVAAVRVNPVAYHYDADGKPGGVDYDLLRMFAARLGRCLKIIPTGDVEQALALVEQSKAQLAAGFLTLPQARPGIAALPPYHELEHRIVHYYRASSPPRALAELPSGSAVESAAHPAQIAALGRGAARLEVHDDLGAPGILALVDKGIADFAIVDSSDLRLLKRFFPRVKTAFTLPGVYAVRWFAAARDGALRWNAEQFFRGALASGALAAVENRYFGPAGHLSYGEKLTVVEHIANRLPAHQSEFKRTAALLQLDWKLLAAISYQESHWDARARSPTGARGLMMLTSAIAAEFGGGDRLNPADNIAAGARYFLKLRDALPPEVPEPDRSWLGLAAYNVGPRHVQAARARAAAVGLDAGRWTTVRQFLGPRAAGAGVRNKPAEYVLNVRAYYDLIAWINHESPYRTAGPASL